MVPVLYQYFTSRTMEEEMKLYTQEQVNLVKANYFISLICCGFLLS